MASTRLLGDRLALHELQRFRGIPAARKLAMQCAENLASVVVGNWSERTDDVSRARGEKSATETRGTLSCCAQRFAGREHDNRMADMHRRDAAPRHKLAGV